MLSGGPQSVHDQGVSIDQWLDQVNCPLLGICYGLQALAAASGATVASGKVGEYGKAHVELKPSTLWSRVDNSSEPLSVWMSHMDAVQSCLVFDINATSAHAPIAGIAHKKALVWSSVSPRGHARRRQHDCCVCSGYLCLPTRLANRDHAG